MNKTCRTNKQKTKHIYIYIRHRASGTKWSVWFPLRSSITSLEPRVSNQLALEPRSWAPGLSLWLAVGTIKGPHSSLLGALGTTRMTFSVFFFAFFLECPLDVQKSQKVRKKYSKKFLKASQNHFPLATFVIFGKPCFRATLQWFCLILKVWRCLGTSMTRYKNRPGKTNT